MPASEPWWISREILAALAGVMFGFLLSLITEWCRGRARRRTHWAALHAEMEYCRCLAETYIRDKKAAPLYRLPTVAYANSLPALLASGALNEVDTRSLISFFNEVETLNRGLSQAEGARLIEGSAERDAKLADEYGRNRLKAERLVPCDGHTPSYYDRAKSVMESRLRWYRP